MVPAAPMLVVVAWGDGSNGFRAIAHDAEYLNHFENDDLMTPVIRPLLGFSRSPHPSPLRVVFLPDISAAAALPVRVRFANEPWFIAVQSSRLRRAESRPAYPP